MAVPFQQLGWADTPAGPISLWRRHDPSLDVDVYEVKLGDEYLMSSLFTVAEVELARLGLAGVEGADLDVVVGGLGLGWTARAALEDDRVGDLLVVEALGEVIEWHERDLVPGGGELSADPRTRYVHADFFALAASTGGFDADRPGRRFDAILLDIDHTPDHTLADGHRSLYTDEGLRRLRNHLRDGGVFALWSDRPVPAFLDTLRGVFPTTQAHEVTFPNPITRGESANTIYVAR